ncbi:MAG: hypothetical protein IJU54_01320 [Alphaproteobacteria bacterium]|nr:hypothetical protein [Alphaproteobacteria bacterium]
MKSKLITLLLIVGQFSTSISYSSDINETQNTINIIGQNNATQNQTNIFNKCIKYLSEQYYDNLEVNLNLSSDDRNRLEKFNSFVHHLFNNEDEIHYNSEENLGNCNSGLNIQEDSSNNCNNGNDLSDNNYCFEEFLIEQFQSENSDAVILKNLLKQLQDHISDNSLNTVINLLDDNKYIPFIIDIIHINFYNTVVKELQEYISQHKDLGFNTIQSILMFFDSKGLTADCLEYIICDEFRRNYVEQMFLDPQNDLNTGTLTADNTDLFDIKEIIKQIITLYQNTNNSYSEYLNQYKSKYYLQKIRLSKYYEENISYVKNSMTQGYITNPYLVKYFETYIMIHNKSFY